MYILIFVNTHESDIIPRICLYMYLICIYTKETWVYTGVSNSNQVAHFILAFHPYLLSVISHTDMRHLAPSSYICLFVLYQYTCTVVSKWLIHVSMVNNFISYSTLYMYNSFCCSFIVSTNFPNFLCHWLSLPRFIIFHMYILHAFC